MGYYSEYRLDIDLKNTAYTTEELIAHLRDQNNYAARALLPNGETAYSDTWYSSNDDMQTFSTHYPDVVFVLERLGHFFGDVEKCYFKNGKMTQAYGSIYRQDFDEQPFEKVQAQLIEFSEKVETKLKVDIRLTGSPNLVAQKSHSTLANLYQELINTYPDANYALDATSESWCFYGHKWKNYDADLLDFSEKHPELFILVSPFIEDCDHQYDGDIARLQQYEIFEPPFNPIYYFDLKEFHHGLMRRSKATWFFDSVYDFISSKKLTNHL